uniref:Uncharacterized protein n=1 Tax=Rhizophora mucronata TaxID=61149 RepID=A0A2P2PKK2_RHIMU
MFICFFIRSSFALHSDRAEESFSFRFFRSFSNSALSFKRICISSSFPFEEGSNFSVAIAVFSEDFFLQSHVLCSITS